jgi:integrase
MMLRVEQGEGRKDRFAMLSPQLLELLRDWWRIARPPVWMFPGRDRISQMSTRQFNRVCHIAAELAGLPKWVAPHRPAAISTRSSFAQTSSSRCMAARRCLVPAPLVNTMTLRAKRESFSAK